MDPPPPTRPAIPVNKNKSYGGPNTPVTQKYRPLMDIQLDRRRDMPLCSGLLSFRRQLLFDAGMLPQPLRLVAPDWASLIEAERHTMPPLVVVSSNRSNWIAAGVTAARRQLEALGLKHFDNVSDLRALTAKDGQEVSPPIYCPARLGANPNRNVYVLVHKSEYETYCRNLEGTGITTIGWFFQPPADKAIPSLVGFGASRYAAIEFCKHLCGQGAAWRSAWLLDDNVVALTGFAGLSETEKALAADPRLACAGFHGGSIGELAQSNRDYARKEIAAGRGGQAAELPDSNPPGILQQAVLWNIDYFIGTNSNFGVVFVTSAEDVSLGCYFDTHDVPYLCYRGIGIRKEQAVSDGNQQIAALRQNFHQWITDAEAGASANPPPPTVVQPLDGNDGGVQRLADFVVDRVLPNSELKADMDKPAVQRTARSQAVEQIVCQAIEERVVDDETLALTFCLNGKTRQVVQLFTPKKK